MTSSDYDSGESLQALFTRLHASTKTLRRAEVEHARLSAMAHAEPPTMGKQQLMRQLVSHLKRIQAHVPQLREKLQQHGDPTNLLVDSRYHADLHDVLHSSSRIIKMLDGLEESMRWAAEFELFASPATVNCLSAVRVLLSRFDAERAQDELL